MSSIRLLTSARATGRALPPDVRYELPDFPYLAEHGPRKVTRVGPVRRAEPLPPTDPLSRASIRPTRWSPRSAPAPASTRSGMTSSASSPPTPWPSAAPRPSRRSATGTTAKTMTRHRSPPCSLASPHWWGGTLHCLPDRGAPPGRGRIRYLCSTTDMPTSPSCAWSGCVQGLSASSEDAPHVVVFVSWASAGAVEVQH
jgi:hypothetical protein